MSLTPVTLRNATDTFVFQGRSSENFADAIRLRVDNTTSNVCYTFVHFARPFPLGATVVSAHLKLYSAGSWTAVSRTITVERITSQWKVGSVTYATAPTVTATGAVALTSAAAKVDGDVWDFDVTAMMQLVADGTGWYGFRVRSNESALRRFHSAQSSLANGAYKPILEVTYSMPPAAPSTLSPSGNRSVSVAKPILRFDFNDQAGNTALQAVNVQINATNVWTAPSFDSGTVTTSDAQLDLSTTAYAGLAVGSSTYWRVRVQDASGQWSGWSDAAQFTRTAKGTLTITNPAASPSNFVTEATPPITWTFTGTTQKAWQVIIEDSAGDQWLHTSGKLTSAATSYTLPALVIHDSTTYTLAIRVWDTVDREGTPNDPAYVEATRTFTYNKTGATVVTAFTGTDLTPEPGVQLNWTDATAPDSYTITRDGKVIAAGVLAADVLVSGTSYRYTDRGAAPRASHTWEVRRVVNGVTSTSNPQVTKTLTPLGIWLIDDARNIRQQIMGDDEGDWEMGEQADVYEPLGSTEVVRITQALRGYQGHISGTLAANAVTGQTIDQAEANMWDLKRKAGQKLKLVLSNVAITCVIGNVLIKPSPETEIVKDVEFDFWQVDDLPFTPLL